MTGLPSGTVTFAFTDIEGSTALLKRLGDDYGHVLAEHRRIVRETFGGANGVEIDTQGDAFFFAFPSARDAVAAAVAAQRSHATQGWPDGAAVRVRIGLHTGEPVLGDEGYLGLDVVRAARICTVARGGTVLLSESTRALLGSKLPDGVAVFPRGERHLKDIDEPERVYELDIEGVTAAEPEPAPLARDTAAAESRAEEQEGDVDERIESFGERLAADVRRQVLEKLERKLGAKAEPPASPSAGDGGADGNANDADDADVDDIAARASSLEERIQARVAALLRDRGISADEPPDA